MKIYTPDEAIKTDFALKFGRQLEGDLKNTITDFVDFLAVNVFDQSAEKTYLITLGNGRVFYYYHTGEIAFIFDLFSEIGARWQTTYQAIIQEYGLQIETKEFEEKPWICDVLKGTHNV